MKSKKNFWQEIKKPFFCLAPMADVTDIAFRSILSKYGKPDVTWTEFVSADGLCHKEGRKKLFHFLKFSPRERPIVAQVFGANPENMEKACRIISKMKFDGIDINMGCPDKSVIKQGAGSALIKTPKLAQEIIRSAIRGANGIPISVKTRIGFNKEEIDTWIPVLLGEDIKALTIHARTKKEMSKVPADWSYIKKVVDIVKKNKRKILIIGNGDIKSIEEGKKKIKETGCDGVMIGRGVFGNPWFFANCDQGRILNLQKGSTLVSIKIKALIEHIKIFDKKLFKPGHKNYAVMKKHFKAYINGFAGAKELREKIMETDTPKQTISILTDFIKTLN